MELALREDPAHLAIIEFPNTTRAQSTSGLFEIVVTCSCGARWTHPYGTGPETVKGIYRSHVAIAKRVATRVD